MTIRTQLLTTTLAILFAASLPLAAGAQNPKDQPKAAAAPHPAAHAAPQVHPQVHAAPAFHPHPVARVAPHVTPHVVQHVTPHAVPHRAAGPVQHVTPNVRHATRQHTQPVVHQPQPNTQIKTQTQANTHTNSGDELRPNRRDELRHTREDHAHRNGQTPSGAAATLQTQPNARTNAQTNIQSNGQLRHAGRHGRTHVTTQAARQGRFAAPFNASLQASATNRSAHARAAHLAARRAWHRGLRASFVPWYGPVFWPYAYSDIFDYAFWPGGYDDGYWAYAYDDFFDGLFWGEQEPPSDYVYAEPYAASSAPPVRQAAVAELCEQPGTGITAWPFAEIAQKVDLNSQQKTLLGNLRAAADEAKGTFQKSCPPANDFSLTPPGRLQAMSARLGATLAAVRTVKPALAAFYNSLSDEQKERFNEIGPQGAGNKVVAKASETNGATPQETNNCKQPKPGLTNLPIEKIEDVVKPSDAQQADLDQLSDAADKAVSVMQAACPDETPLTPTGRLNAVETRLQAMIDAANTVKPALDHFYSSLSNEQKARFNRIGSELAQDNG